MYIFFIISSLIVGFQLGKNFSHLQNLLKYNKISVMRKNICNRNWLINKYQNLINKTEENNDFRKWQCNSFFVGELSASHNMKLLEQRVKTTERQLSFIKEHIKNTDISYYIKYIGELTDEEVKVFKRNNRLKNILHNG